MNRDTFGHIQFGVPNTPQGACCIGNFAGVYFPHKTFGYKRLDARVAKTFKMPWGHDLTVDFQVFNVFNWLNRTYSTWGAGAGNPPPLVEHGALETTSASSRSAPATSSKFGEYHWEERNRSPSLFLERIW
jgi:hypothetical protein